MGSHYLMLQAHGFHYTVAEARVICETHVQGWMYILHPELFCEPVLAEMECAGVSEA